MNVCLPIISLVMVAPVMLIEVEVVVVVVLCHQLTNQLKYTVLKSGVFYINIYRKLFIGIDHFQ